MDLQELLETYVPDSHLLTSFPEDIKEVLVEKFGGWYTYPSHMTSPEADEL